MSSLRPNFLSMPTYNMAILKSDISEDTRFKEGTTTNSKAIKEFFNKQENIDKSRGWDSFSEITRFGKPNFTIELEGDDAYVVYPNNLSFINRLRGIKERVLRNTSKLPQLNKKNY